MSELTENNSKRALITGITGQDGVYLSRLLFKKGYQVYGLVRRIPKATSEINYVIGDLTDADSLQRCIQQVQPDEVYNLAAQSHVQESVSTPELTSDVNGQGCVRLLEAIRCHHPAARFFQAGSSAMYGHPVESPQTESTPFSPTTPYAIAKQYAHLMTSAYRELHSIYAVNGILYNHESPLRSRKFVTRKITRGAAEIAAGHCENLSLGNLNAQRDWGYAGDYVEAMWRSLQQEYADDYVVATGLSHTVKDVCRLAFSTAGIQLEFSGTGVEEVGYSADGRVLVKIDPRYYRPREDRPVVGNASYAHQQLTWQPNVTFDELITMMVKADLDDLQIEGL